MAKDELNPLDGLIPTSVASSLLGKPAAAISRMVRTGRLTPAHKLPGLTGAYLFRRTDVEALARDEIAKATERAAKLSESLGRTA